jgi:hypothetical protein
MTQGKYVELSAAQWTDVWCRWKAGDSLHTIGRAVNRPHTSIHCLLAHHGGIVPAVRRRSVLALTVVEREDISRGLASGSSIRDKRTSGIQPDRKPRSTTFLLPVRNSRAANLPRISGKTI